MAATRGMPTNAWRGQSMFRHTVGIPRSSITLATSPTDLQQSGQTGARMARSTSSLCIDAAMAGADSASRAVVSLPWYPMIE